MSTLMSKVRSAIRGAIGKVTPRVPDLKLLETPTELQKAMAHFRNAPQYLRLALLYRITKRQYRKRRHGVSAKSSAANRKLGKARLAMATGIGSYTEFKRQQAADRAARRAQS